LKWNGGPTEVARDAVDELWGFEAVAHMNNHLGFFHRKMGRKEC